MALGKFLFSSAMKPVKWGGKGALWGAKTLYKGGPLGRAGVAGTIGGIYGFATSPLEGFDALGDAASWGTFGALLGAGSWAVPRAIKGSWKTNQAIGRGTNRIISRFKDWRQGMPRLKEFQRTSPFVKGPMHAGGSANLARGGWANFKASPMGVTSRGAVGFGKRLGTFAMYHPGLTIAGVGAVGVGGALALGGERSPTMAGADVNVRYDQQMIAAQDIMAGSIAPMGGIGTYPQFVEMEQRRAAQRQQMRNSTSGLVQGLHRGRHG